MMRIAGQKVGPRVDMLQKNPFPTVLKVLAAMTAIPHPYGGGEKRTNHEHRKDQPRTFGPEALQSLCGRHEERVAPWPGQPGSLLECYIDIANQIA